VAGLEAFGDDEYALTQLATLVDKTCRAHIVERWVGFSDLP